VASNQIAAIKFSEAVPAAPGPEQQKILVTAHRYQNLAEVKELEPPK
jgi:hypothetical protein